MTDAIPDFLVRYLDQRNASRADAINAFLATLTDRERALIKDAAVMGYVRGRMHPTGEKHPKDSAVLVEVIDAALAIPDLYPAINAHLADEPQALPKTEWIVEYKTDGAWTHLGIYPKEQADFMVSDLAARVMETRLVRATTTYTVESTPKEGPAA